jgi:hypothetical protein
MSGTGGLTVDTDPLRPSLWRSRFRRAEMRIVTGSRTLLEAMEVGGPFLYFNGALGAGVRRRPHRPEKARAWLELARRAGISNALRSDIRDFARGRRVAEVVRRAARKEDGWRRFPSHLGPVGFSAARRDAGQVVVAVARELARPDALASQVVTRWRGSNP